MPVQPVATSEPYRGHREPPKNFVGVLLVDLDKTMTYSEGNVDYYILTTQSVAARWGLNLEGALNYDGRTYRARHRLMNDALGWRLAAEQLQTFDQRVLDEVPQYRDAVLVMPGANSMLDDAIAAGYIVAAYTNGARTEAEWAARNLFGSRFDVVITPDDADSLLAAKPEIEVFNAGLAKIEAWVGRSINRGTCINYGDSEPDLLSAVYGEGAGSILQPFVDPNAPAEVPRGIDALSPQLRTKAAKYGALVTSGPAELGDALRGPGGGARVLGRTIAARRQQLIVPMSARDTGRVYISRGFPY